MTANQVNRARTSEISLAEALKQAASQLQLSQAGLNSALAQYEHSKAVLEQSRAQHQQSMHAVTTLAPLVNQRGALASAVKTHPLQPRQLSGLRAIRRAHNDGLNISEGAYARVGQQVFTMIDARIWWAIGNFREGTLQHIMPGMAADVYVLSKPSERFAGIVDSVGFGVTPNADDFGTF